MKRIKKKSVIRFIGLIVSAMMIFFINSNSYHQADTQTNIEQETNNNTESGTNDVGDQSNITTITSTKSKINNVSNQLDNTTTTQTNFEHETNNTTDPKANNNDEPQANNVNNQSDIQIGDTEAKTPTKTNTQTKKDVPIIGQESSNHDNVYKGTQTLSTDKKKINTTPMPTASSEVTNMQSPNKTSDVISSTILLTLSGFMILSLTGLWVFNKKVK